MAFGRDLSKHNEHSIFRYQVRYVELSLTLTLTLSLTRCSQSVLHNRFASSRTAGLTGGNRIRKSGEQEQHALSALCLTADSHASIQPRSSEPSSGRKIEGNSNSLPCCKPMCTGNNISNSNMKSSRIFQSRIEASQAVRQPRPAHLQQVSTVRYMYCM